VTAITYPPPKIDDEKDWKHWTRINCFVEKFETFMSVSKSFKSVDVKATYENLMYFGATEIKVNQDIYASNPLGYFKKQIKKGSCVELRHHSNWNGYSFPIDDIPSFFWKNVFTNTTLNTIRQYFDCRRPAVSQVEIIFSPRNSKSQTRHRDHQQGPLTSLCIAIAVSADKKIKTLFKLGSHITKETQLHCKPAQLVNLGEGGVNAAIFDAYVIHAGGPSGIAEADPRMFITLEPYVECDLEKLKDRDTEVLTKKYSTRLQNEKYVKNKMKVLEQSSSEVKEVMDAYSVSDLPSAKRYLVDYLLAKD
jgi:hypothetical protein